MDNCCTPKLNKTNTVTPCPKCVKNGEKVKGLTIEKMLNEPQKLSDKISYFLCFNPECEVAYYNNSNENIFLISDIRVPIWFKKDAEPKYICYCSNVTEDEIIDAIKTKGCKTVRDVVANTNAMKISKCDENSPTGKCCSRQINDLLSSVRNDL